MTPYQPYQPYPGSNVMAPSGPPPVLVAVAPPAPQPRFGVFFRLILAIPHMFVLAVLAIVAFVVVFIGWWGALFTARLPRFAVDYLSGWLRWWGRVNAYLFLLTDAYPPFTPDEAPEYPVRIAIPPAQRLNRAAVFFRFILALPVAFLAGILFYGAGTLIAFVAWLVTLVAGRLPSSFHLAYTALLRFQIRYYGYYFMLTPAYPGGLYGDEPGTVTWADEAQTDQVPSFGTPGSVYGGPGSPYDSPGSAYGTPGYSAPGYGTGYPAPGYGTGYPAPGYGAPEYPAAAGYGAPAGYYQAQPAAQPANWLLPLTSAAKGLVTTFIVLGALLDVGNVVLNFTLNKVDNPVTAFNRGVAGSQLRTSYTTLSNSLDTWHQATASCGQNLTCVTRQDGKAATFFTTFSSQLASTSVPADATAAKAKVAADAAAVAQDLTQLSKPTTVSQYEATVASTGLQQALTAFDTDFAALMNDLGVPTTS